MVDNPFHIDLVDTYSGGNNVFAEFNLKTGANQLTIKASDLDGGTLYLEQQPSGKTEWYRKSAGAFTDASLDSDKKLWLNTLLGEGKVRVVLEGSLGGSVIEEMSLRPTHETDINL